MVYGNRFGYGVHDSDGQYVRGKREGIQKPFKRTDTGAFGGYFVLMQEQEADKSCGFSNKMLQSQ